MTSYGRSTFTSLVRRTSSRTIPLVSHGPCPSYEEDLEKSGQVNTLTHSLLPLIHSLQLHPQHGHSSEPTSSTSSSQRMKPKKRAISSSAFFREGAQLRTMSLGLMLSAP